MKIRPVGAKLFYADRQTDRHDKANSLFGNFMKEPRNAVTVKKISETMKTIKASDTRMIVKLFKG